MRRRLPLILALLLAIACASMWVRSYWRFDYFGTDAVVASSEFGSVYVWYDGLDFRHGYDTGKGGAYGRIETQYTNRVARRARSGRGGSTSGEGFFAIRWWTVTSVSALPAWWAWRRARRRRDGTRGFEVAGPA